MANTHQGLNLKVVNQNNLLINYKPNNLVKVSNPYYKPLIKNTFLLVDKTTYEQFLKMAFDAKKLGYELYIDSGYRSNNYQRKVLEYYLKTIGNEAYQKVALPGSSEHILGTAIDLGIFLNNKYYDELSDDMLATKWVHANAYKYGFIIRYPKDAENKTGFSYEPWHLRYVGLKLATYLTYNNITLDEYNLDLNISK